MKQSVKRNLESWILKNYKPLSSHENVPAITGDHILVKVKNRFYGPVKFKEIPTEYIV